jgi:hypothetical protein
LTNSVRMHVVMRRYVCTMYVSLVERQVCMLSSVENQCTSACCYVCVCIMYVSFG